MPCSEPLFRTTRMAVRLYRAADFAAHARLRADPAVARFMHWDEAVADFPGHIAGWRDRRPPDDAGWINLAVENARGAFIGDLGLLTEGALGTFGLALAAPARGVGKGRELAQGAMAWLARHGAARFRVEIDDANLASRALFGALGFARCGDGADRFGDFGVYERAA